MIGKTLSHFEITAKLGEGGMGEVYRAEDNRLGREVAIKVLPEAFTANPERLARFEREARLLASLNHPNIASIHQVDEVEGHRLLVMELVEGEDLSVRLQRGPLAMEDTLAISLQIAESLEWAHERGIIHRDLKPANIVVRPDGQAKILDFGLAKALESPGSEGSSPSLSLSPTLTAGMTSAGALLGTAAYMSPEQAKGKESDRRADIWAFGVVVWEMLTGKRLFAGDSVSDTLAAVLRDEVDLSALPGETPATLRAILARCLDRDPQRRLRDIGEARIALAALAGGEATSTLVGSSPAIAEEAPPRDHHGRAGWFVALAASIVALWLGVVAFGPEKASESIIYSVVPAPEKAQLDVGSGLALSPDGKLLVFAASDSTGERALWIWAFENGDSFRLPGTEGAIYPFWSPDSRHIGFMSSGGLKRIPALGKTTQTLAKIREGRGGAWGPDGTIVFSLDFRGGLWRIDATGGEPIEVTELDHARGEQSHRFPVFLPDGRRLLFLSQTAEGSSAEDDSRIEILDLETGERTPVIETNASMAFAEPDRLLLWREGSLMAAHLDVESGSLRGDPVLIAQDIGYTGNEFATFSISENGLLAYQSGALYNSFTGIDLVDESGEILQDKSPVTDLHQVLKLSSDGKRAVYFGPDNSTLWIRDLERQATTRFTFEEGDHFDGVWSPDDAWIAYVTNQSGRFQIYRKSALGLGESELIYETDSQLQMHDWSQDGRFLSVDKLDTDGNTDFDIVAIDAKTGDLEVLVKSPFYDSQGKFSPDGRWLAYVSTDSGRFEVYIVPISGEGGKFQISTASGLHPEWSPDGSKLYYVNPSVGLMEVDLDLDLSEGVRIGIPRELFKIRHQFDRNPPFQVMPDGKSFLILQLEQETRGGQLTLVQNWMHLDPR